MYLTQKIKDFVDTIYIDLMGGNISIRTHSQPELIIDARKIRYVGLIPQMEVDGNIVYIHKQATTSFFPQAERAGFKILIPDNKIVNCKMFGGEISINGNYNSLNIKLRNGNVTIDGPYFSISNNSVINITTGNIIQKRLTENSFAFSVIKETETSALYQQARLHSTVSLGQVTFT